LREYFAGFGEVKEVRVEKEKREVFVGFAARANAEKVRLVSSIKTVSRADLLE